jgi:hypothetical protein
MIHQWPEGLVKGMLEAVCPNRFAVEAATLHKKGMRVLTALEVLANARSQKHHVLQRFLSDVLIIFQRKLTNITRFFDAMRELQRRFCTSSAHVHLQRHLRDMFGRMLQP